MSRPEAVHLQAAEALQRDIDRNGAVAGHLCVVSDAAEEPVRDTGRSAAAAGDLGETVLVRLHLQDVGRARDNLLQFVGVVELEAVHEAKAVAQGRADHRVSRRRADEGEGLEVEAEAAGARALADDDVYGELLHCRVEHLLHHAAEAVDLVNEEDVAGLEAGEDGSKVACALDGGAGGYSNADAHLLADDVSEGGLAEAGRAVEEYVFKGLAALTRGGDADAEILLDAALADILAQPAGPQGAVQPRVLQLFRAGYQPLFHRLLCACQLQSF